MTVSPAAMSRPIYLHFGAGNIGRSLAGALFARGGYDVLFVDALPEIVNALHARRCYRVVVKDDLPAGAPAEFLIEHVDAIAAQDTDAVTEAVARADVIGTSVGAGVLPRVLAAMAPGLHRRRRPVSIILCENLHRAATMGHQQPRQKPGPELVLPPMNSMSSPTPTLPAGGRAPHCGSTP